ncbi:MAG: alanine racemase [Pseudomonadota bacterium]
MSTAPTLQIDLNALVSNWKTLASHSGNAETSAVIKADAYGLGIEPVATALSKAGCKTFFVAMAHEGARVRACNKEADIYLLNGLFPDTVDPILEHQLKPVLSSRAQISLWQKVGNSNPCAIHVDTGMNRLGLDVEEAIDLAADQSEIVALNPDLLMSHLACGDEPDDPMNGEQLQRFVTVKEKFAGIRASFANSAGIMLGPDYHFDVTRPGISMYGGEAVNNVPNPMKPVVTASARILQIRDGKIGETVGYGATATLNRETKIAVCSAGYADGFHRAASGAGVSVRGAIPQGGFGYLDGYKIPLIGRVSMDLCAFDVTEVPDQTLNDCEWVELFGANIPVDDAARACGTIGYELLTSLGSRYRREYKH